MTVNGPAYTGLHVRDPNLKKASSINGEELKLLRAGDSWQLIGKDGKVQEKFDLDTFSRGTNGELELNKDKASDAELKKLEKFKSFKELTGREYGNIVAGHELNKETTLSLDSFSGETFKLFSSQPVNFNGTLNLPANAFNISNPATPTIQPFKLSDKPLPQLKLESSQIWENTGAKSLETQELVNPENRA